MTAIVVVRVGLYPLVLTFASLSARIRYLQAVYHCFVFTDGERGVPQLAKKL